MTDEIQKILNQLPEEPGVYKMLDANDRIIYIGKSKCLKKRVKSYFVPSPKWEKVKKMTPFISKVEYEVTDTHLEAMLLECELIKSVRPYFNVLMKNDQRYVYMKLESRPSKKPLSVVYQREEDSFGPFRRKQNLQDIEDFLLHFYPIIKLRKYYRFEYHFFPLKMDQDTYMKNRTALQKLFTNTDETEVFLREAEKKMKTAAREYHFETASAYKNLMEQMSYITKVIRSHADWTDKKLYADIEIKSGHKLFFIANGFVVHKRIFKTVTEEQKKEFIEEGIEKMAKAAAPVDDKGSVDYRNIIFSELAHNTTELVD